MWDYINKLFYYLHSFIFLYNCIHTVPISVDRSPGICPEGYVLNLKTRNLLARLSVDCNWHAKVTESLVLSRSVLCCNIFGQISHLNVSYQFSFFPPQIFTIIFLAGKV